jgi:competence protein ComEA
MKYLLSLLVALVLSIGAAFAAVNVNTATSEELQTLKGIGPSKAKAIIDYRAKNGSFKTLDDLDKVPGIGEATIRGFKSDVTFSGKTTVTAAEKSDKSAKKKEEKPAKETKPAPKEAKPEPKDAKAESKDKPDAKKAPAADSKKAEAKDSKDSKAKPAKKDESAK